MMSNSVSNIKAKGELNLCEQQNVLSMNLQIF